MIMIMMTMRIVMNVMVNPEDKGTILRQDEIKGNDDNRKSCVCCEKSQTQDRGEISNLNSQVDSAFEGARKITSEEYQAGDRFAVQRHEDSLRLGTEVKIYLTNTVFNPLTWTMSSNLTVHCTFK